MIWHLKPPSLESLYVYTVFDVMDTFWLAQSWTVVAVVAPRVSCGLMKAKFHKILPPKANFSVIISMWSHTHTHTYIISAPKWRPHLLLTKSIISSNKSPADLDSCTVKLKTKQKTKTGRLQRAVRTTCKLTHRLSTCQHPDRTHRKNCTRTDYTAFACMCLTRWLAG